MRRSLSPALITLFFAALSLAAQSPSITPAQSPQEPTPQPDPPKPKKVWTNENIPHANGNVSVVGDPKSKPKAGKAKPADDKYVASLRKQLDKLQKQIDDVSKELVDLKNFSQGDSSNNSSGMKLNKSYNREPVDVQIRALENKKKDLQGQMDALLDEAHKKGVEPGQLR